MKRKKSTFERQHETYCKAAKYVNESRGKKLSRAFTRKPYALAVKEAKQ